MRTFASRRDQLITPEMLLRQSHETFFFSLFSMGGVWDICLFFFSSPPGFVLFIAVAVLLTHAHDGKYIGKNI